MGKNKKYPRTADKAVEPVVLDETPVTIEKPVEEEPITIPEEPAEEKKEEVKIVTGVVTGVDSCLNIRKAPIVSENNIIAILGKGVSLSVVEPDSVIEENNELWYRVIVNEETEGFAMKKYITLD